MSIVKRTYASGRIGWRVTIWSAGDRHESATFSTLREAKAWQADRTTKSRHPGWVPDSAGQVTMATVAEQWLSSRRNVAPLTLATDRSVWDRLVAPTFRSRKVGDIVTADVTTWLGDLAGRDIAPSSRRRALAVLRGALGYAVADRLIMVSPATTVKPPRGGARREGQALTADELTRLLEEVTDQTRPAILCLAITGLRVSEMCGLTAGDVMTTPHGLGLRAHRSISQEPLKGKTTIGDMKSHRARLVPVPLVLLAWVQNRVAEVPQPDTPLFPTRTGGHWTRSNLATRSDWYRARVRTGLPDLRIHDLRHTAATALLTAGADVLAVSRILGHSTPTLTLSLYGHVLDQGVFDAMARLPHPQRTSPPNLGEEDTSGKAS